MAPIRPVVYWQNPLAKGSYLPLTNPSAPNDVGQQRTITDLNVTGTPKFYRVEITKP